ncbi:MAG: hypothetical protein WA705_24045 [Candidatus Ozemobacteraceae bacterium]
MRFLHPLFMLGFFGLLYQQRALGFKILGLKERAPDFADRGSLLQKHRTWAIGLLIWGILGMIGGVVMTLKVLEAPTAFQHTYGHAFCALLVIACVFCAFALGVSIKKVVKPKIRERFLSFHVNIVYVIMAFGTLALATGAGVLIWGISIGS